MDGTRKRKRATESGRRWNGWLVSDDAAHSVEVHSPDECTAFVRGVRLNRTATVHGCTVFARTTDGRDAAAAGAFVPLQCCGIIALPGVLVPDAGSAEEALAAVAWVDAGCAVEEADCIDDDAAQPLDALAVESDASMDDDG